MCNSAELGSCSAVAGTVDIFLLLINTLYQGQCPLDTSDLYNECYDIKDGESYDYIVIGSGSAGAVVANRLSADPNTQVLLIEAGKKPSPYTEIPAVFFNLVGTEEDWYNHVDPGKICQGLYGDGTCRWSAGKTLGGSSSINGQIYIKGCPADYDNWLDQGNPGWDYESVTPYFKKCQDVQRTDLDPEVYGRGGNLKIIQPNVHNHITEMVMEAAKELRQPIYNEMKPLGYFETLATIYKGQRFSTAKAFLAPCKDRNNLKIAFNTEVDRVLINPSTKTTYGVVARKENGDLVTVGAKKEIIISAGVVNSPQILLKSGIGRPNELIKAGVEPIHDLPVGYGLHDHIFLHGVIYTIDEDSPEYPYGTIDAIYNYILKREGPLKDVGLFTLIGLLATNPNSPWADIQMHHGYFPKNDQFGLPAFLKFFAVNDTVRESIFKHNKEKAFFVFIPKLIQPLSRGRIYLESKYKRPKIDPNYLGEQADEDAILRAVEYVKKFAATNVFKAVNATLLDYTHDCKSGSEIENWKCRIRTFSSAGFHAVGSCKMGPDPKTSTVDSRLRVHGIKNLRVCDASIMPKIVRGNTNAATIMIGERGSALILEDHANDNQV